MKDYLMAISPRVSLSVKKYNVMAIISAMIFLLCSCNSSSESILRQKDVNVSNAVVCVNGYYIFSDDVENVYNEYKEAGISRDKIIEDSISEILVV